MLISASARSSSERTEMCVHALPATDNQPSQLLGGHRLTVGVLVVRQLLLLLLLLLASSTGSLRGKSIENPDLSRATTNVPLIVSKLKESF